MAIMPRASSAPALAALSQNDPPTAAPPRRHRPKVNPNTLKRVRLAVYQRDGFRCRHCGWQPQIPEDYDGSSALCGVAEPSAPRRRPYRILELDHVLPYSRGGRFELNNLQALCNVCNTRKGAKV